MASHWQELVRCATDFAGAAHLPAGADARVPAERRPSWRTLRVEHLAFGYGRGRGLEVAGLELRRGGRVALVGESGSGKSTLLRLLAGLYEAEGARLRLDGAPIGATALHGFATLVPQTPEIFEATLLDNLTLGRELPLIRVLAACETAELTQVVAGLPQGLATPLGERGANLSGGQKQRVAIARAILAADPQGLLLLDEPTSSLDPETEARLYEKLVASFPEACIVSSIHRPHLLWRFDEVVEMAAGRIIARRSTAPASVEAEAQPLAA
jgi:ABC-type bacteriocin/lantibiotic exporter with double-glycine peptidase domain